MRNEQAGFRCFSGFLYGFPVVFPYYKGFPCKANSRFSSSPFLNRAAIPNFAVHSLFIFARRARAGLSGFDVSGFARQRADVKVLDGVTTNGHGCGFLPQTLMQDAWQRASFVSQGR